MLNSMLYFPVFPLIQEHVLLFPLEVLDYVTTPRLAGAGVRDPDSRGGRQHQAERPLGFDPAK